MRKSLLLILLTTLFIFFSLILISCVSYLISYLINENDQQVYIEIKSIEESHISNEEKLILYDQLIKRYPSFSFVFAKKAELLFKKNKLNGEIAILFKEYLRKYPLNYNANIILSVHYFLKSREAFTNFSYEKSYYYVDQAIQFCSYAHLNIIQKSLVQCELCNLTTSLINVDTYFITNEHHQVFMSVLDEDIIDYYPKLVGDYYHCIAENCYEQNIKLDYALNLLNQSIYLYSKNYQYEYLRVKIFLKLNRLIEAKSSIIIADKLLVDYNKDVKELKQFLHYEINSNNFYYQVIQNDKEKLRYLNEAQEKNKLNPSVYFQKAVLLKNTQSLNDIRHYISKAFSIMCFDVSPFHYIENSGYLLNCRQIRALRNKLANQTTFERLMHSFNSSNIEAELKDLANFILESK